jgi:TM2 domain-containing membrane protein YozV
MMAKKKRSLKKPLVRVSTYVKVREINWVLLLVMSIIFGWLGVDRFMMGKVGTGLLKLFTLGGLGIWWLIDVILIATKYEYKNVEYTE